MLIQNRIHFRYSLYTIDLIHRYNGKRFDMLGFKSLNAKKVVLLTTFMNYKLCILLRR